MIKRTTTIVTILVLILGVAIVFAKASPRVGRRQVSALRVKGDVYALRNLVTVNEGRDLTSALHRRERVAVNHVERPVESDVAGVAHYGRVLGWRHVQNDPPRYGVDNCRARRLVEQVNAKSVRVSRAVQVEMATVTRQSVDRGVFMKLAVVPRQLSDSVPVCQERLTDALVNSVELVTVGGV